MEVETIRSDEELDYQAIIRRVIDGERDAFTQLVRSRESEVFAMIMRQVGVRELAEELCQETFIKAYRALPRFRHDARFSTWLIRIALNTTKSYFSSKRFKQRSLTSSIESCKTPLGEQTSTPACIIERGEQQAQIAALRRCLGKIKSKYRDVIVLHILEGKSYAEISQILEIPSGTIGSRINYGIKLLRKEMKRLEQ